MNVNFERGISRVQLLQNISIKLKSLKYIMNNFQLYYAWLEFNFIMPVEKIFARVKYFDPEAALLKRLWLDQGDVTPLKDDVGSRGGMPSKSVTTSRLDC